MKNFILAFSLVAAILVSGCNNAENKTSEQGTTTETTPSSERPAHGEPGHNHETDHQVAAVYSCPMHPEVTSDKPGTCPKCGMDLEKTNNEAAQPGQ